MSLANALSINLYSRSPQLLLVDFLATYNLWHYFRSDTTIMVVDCIWNVMAHAQKPYIVFRRNGESI